MNSSKHRLLQALERVHIQPQLQQYVSKVMKHSEKLEVVLNSIAIGVLVLNNDCKLDLVNREARRLLPITTEKYRGKAIWQVLGHRTIASFLQERLPEQLTFEATEFSQHIAGKEQVLLLSVSSLVHEHKLEGCIILVEDITREKHRTLELRRAENLASLTTAAAGMAHDIRNPLAAISIHLQLIQKDVSEQQQPLFENLQHYTRIISEEVKRLDQTVSDFLALTHHDSLNFSPNSLNDIVMIVLELLLPELQQASIKVHLDLDSQLPDINGDQPSLQRMLVNLIKNAIQAMTDGGLLTLTSHFKDDCVLLDISDNGIGVAPQHLEKIFEPYFTTKNTGSGLGLTMVYRIINQHNASIEIDSQVQQGCTVHLCFPRLQRHCPLLESK